MSTMHLIIDNWFLTPSQPRQLYQDEMVTDKAEEEEEPRRRKIVAVVGGNKSIFQAVCTQGHKDRKKEEEKKWNFSHFQTKKTNRKKKQIN